jgi:predicted permease
VTRVLYDLGYGLRGLARNRGFAIAAILSLGLGIGANTTVFTLLNAIFLRPLPLVVEPERLATVYTLDPRNPGYLYCSLPNFTDYRQRNPVFSSFFAYTGVSLNLTGQGDPEMAMGQVVTAGYFHALGVSPIVGREFSAEETALFNPSPVAVVSYRLWRRRFGGEGGIAGRTIELNGRPYAIIGVAPAGFEGIDTLTATDVWLPVSMYADVYPNPRAVTERRALLFKAVGRLKPGVSRERAESAMQVLAKDLEREYPRENQGRRVKLTSVTEAAIPPGSRDMIARAGLVLMIISALVLLISCGNVASLLLARAAARSKEITVRLALGAGRGRLVQQLLTESMVLGLAGGAAGLAVARWARDLLWSLRPPMFSFAAVHLSLDDSVLAYTLGISLATSVVFGLIPALRATRGNLAADLKERTGQGSPGSRRPRRVLVMIQVALSVVALVGASLFVRSLRNAGRINPGFDADHVGIVVFNVAEHGYDEARGRDFQRRALERAAAVPGVVSASLSLDWPFHVSFARTVLLEGQENTARGEGRRSLVAVVWPGFLRTVGIPLLRGRDLSELDGATAGRVAVVNEVAAANFWPGQDAIGKRIHFSGESAAVEVVGIARNANYVEIGERPQPMMYVSLEQYYYATSVVHVRTAGDPGPVVAAVRREVQALDRNLLLQSESTRDIVHEALWAQRLSADLLAVFGTLALVLAAIGMYGVISYSVSQRTREFGVRMALGATAGDVESLVLREGIRLVAIGVWAGLLLALVLSRGVQSMLFATGARDAFTFLAVPAILVVVGVTACWIPAHRATRVDPARALREE